MEQGDGAEKPSGIQQCCEDHAPSCGDDGVHEDTGAPAVSLLIVCLSGALADPNTLPAARVHPRALTKRDERDCGVFEMDCSRAAGACNNACYHINCVASETETMV